MNPELSEPRKRPFLASIHRAMIPVLKPEDRMERAILLATLTNQQNLKQ